MKIALVAQKYPPIVGGGETHLQNLADGLAADGHEIVVLTSDPGTDPTGYRSPEVRVEYVAGLWEACESLDCKAATASLHERLTAEPWDLVHVFNHVPAMLVSWIRAALSAPLCVSLFETLVPGRRVFDLWGRFELERTIQQSLLANLDPDLLLCGSQAYRRWALASGADDSRIRVVPFGTMTERFAGSAGQRAAARARRGLGDEFVYLVPARPVPRKRIEDALEALAKLLPDHPGSRVVLTLPERTADSDYVSGLRRRLDDLGIGGAVLWEYGVTWQDMPDLYAAADAVLLPSSHEGFGIALIEGMAAGRPVVTSDVEGHDEVIVDGETGWLHPMGDIEALVRCMVAVRPGPESEAVVARARQVAVEQFDVRAMVDGHARAYAELAG